MPYLEYVENGVLKKKPLNDGGTTIVGRDFSCDIQLLTVPTLSRRHFSVYFCPVRGCYALSDLGSTNGTSLNSARIGDDSALKDGDTITISDFNFTFREQDMLADSDTRPDMRVKNDFEFERTEESIDLNALKKTSVASHFDNIILAPGTVIGNKTVRKLIYGTRESSIYLVVPDDGGKDQALKLYRKAIEDKAVQNEFLSAVRTASGIKNAYFVKYQGAGIHENKYCYYISEFMENQSLATVISRKAPIPEGRALDFIMFLAEAFEYSNTVCNVFHGNLTPSKILYTIDATPLIIDYGLSGWINKYISNKAETEPSSAWYISPEQVEGLLPDLHSDMYSVGIILFQMLTGMLPFRAAPGQDLLSMHMHTPFPKIAERNPNITVSPETEAILARLTAKSANDRYSFWDELIHDIEKVFATMDASDRE